eukprot:COSAG06_NODE_21912_length_741_cov_0.778816_1_plen_21_part_10
MKQRAMTALVLPLLLLITKSG